MGGRLQIGGVRKQYGGTVALSDFGLDVEPGEVRGLIGENGSGKSTAMKVLSGEVAPDLGTVEVNGVALPALDPTSRLRAGVGVVMQDPHLCDELSVAENLALGRTGRKGLVSWKRLHDDAQRVLASAGIDLDSRARVGELSQDEKHMVEVARVLAWECSVIGFDETTASLTEDYVDRLFGIMRTLRERGAAQVFISHRLPEIMTICDTVTVLRDGKVVGTVRVAETTEARLIEMMVGRKVDDRYSRRPAQVGDVVAHLEGMRPLANRGAVDLEIRAGEVVGIGGLVGSGRSEILEAVYGLQPRTGVVRIGARTVRPGHPRAAIAAGMGLVPEDRRTRGVAMDQSVRANATMVMDGARPMWSRTDVAAQNDILDIMYRRMKLKAADDSIAVHALSGGNQQKIVLGRWLAHRPRLLLLDEPTRGIDVGAKREIYALIEELAGEGMAILLVSSELPELTGLCDRILMMHEGAVVGEFGREATELELLTAAAGQVA
ncbi:ribose transport system ATP-binding protein/rhamnose transport system ATP-binding protein [Rhodococcus sp. OK519]|uniref:sugar ABC transporter ATP-binding protein n=1 Tax=Rhodococcus sp. OK519 TaxID=2135729 RepID=UPI000D39AAD0|nr:ribose transport system ATP-binding protein/rhamnose transport system ATP-binding protein [Rhodococcus sp. OK519]